MEPIRKQIVYDEHQKPVQVLIAFEDWQRIERELGSVATPNAQTLMGFFGKIDFKGEPLEIQRKMRAEWPE